MDDKIIEALRDARRLGNGSHSRVVRHSCR
jgi:hypothetical protein